MAVRMRRFDEQRWVLDNIIKANGPEWDQARLASLNGAIGTEGNADMAALRARITRLSDIAPAFEALAKRREGRAHDAEAEGQTVLARDNYFIAANYWASAQWPHDENNDENLAFNARKRDCYTRYATRADHRVEEAWVPFKGKALPGWLHLPANAQPGKTPIVVAIPGMDGYKERSVALYGDRWLNRGIGVLVIEGPGQYESAVLGIHVSMENWVATGPAVMDWLLQRPEVDPARVGINGQSFGSFFGSICFANEKRFAAAAVSGTVFEPGCRTLFEEASPTFKKRFMYMSGYEDEAAFDAFAKTITWEPHVGKIDRPFLCVAGGADELSPLEHTDRFVRAIGAPKQLLIYQDTRHSVVGSPATSLGPSPMPYMAEWMAARFAGKPFASERWFVDATGRINKTAY